MRMRRLLWLMLGCWLLWPSAGQAQSPTVHWERYDYVVAVQPNGDLAFQETQVLVVDSGTLRKGALKFSTGDQGHVTAITVSEDGQRYTKSTSGDPGTFSGGDDGTAATISYVFRDSDAQAPQSEH